LIQKRSPNLRVNERSKQKARQENENETGKAVAPDIPLWFSNSSGAKNE